MTIFVSCHLHNYLFTEINTKKHRVVQLYIVVSGAKLDHLGSDTVSVSHVPLVYRMYLNTFPVTIPHACGKYYKGGLRRKVETQWFRWSRGCMLPFKYPSS